MIKRCSVVEGGRRGEIEGDNEDGPTSVRGGHLTIGIEPICGQRNTHITSLLSFVTMNAIKVGPRFTIGWMYHLVRIVMFALFVSCHLFRGLLGHI
jgi:hypothetical protein